MQRKVNYTTLAQASLLIALTILMSFTPLGYLKIGAISITFMTVPVIIAASLLGPLYGGLVGGIFGISSFIQCFGMDFFGTQMFAFNPIMTFVMCVVFRTAIGIIGGYVFKIIYSKGAKNIAGVVVSFLTPALNTILFVTGYALIFENSPLTETLMNNVFQVDNFVSVLIACFLVNGIVETVICTILGFTLIKVLVKLFKK